MSWVWVDGNLRVLTRNTVIDVLIRKHDRREKLWAWIERVLRFGRKAV